MTASGARLDSHINWGFAYEACGARCGVLPDRDTNGFFRKISCLCNAGSPRQGELRRDMGSRPAAEAVTESAATTSMRSGVNSASVAAFTRSTSFFEVGPTLEPIEFAALLGASRAELALKKPSPFVPSSLIATWLPLCQDGRQALGFYSLVSMVCR